MQPAYWKGLDGKMKTRKVLLWPFFFFLCVQNSSIKTKIISFTNCGTRDLSRPNAY